MDGWMGGGNCSTGFVRSGAVVGYGIGAFSWKEVWVVLGKGDLDLVLQRAEVGIWEANGGGLSFYLGMCLKIMWGSVLFLSFGI